MKSLLHNDEFWQETFDLPDGFKEQAIAEMTRAHRGARRARRARIVSAIALLAVLAVSLSLRKNEFPQSTPVAIQAPSWALQPKPFDGIVRTRPLPESIFIGNGAAGPNIVHTGVARHYMEISDQDLLDLTGNRAVAILKVNGAAEFTFLGP